MFRRILQGSELSQLASFVSPAFFEVVPARQMWKRARALLTDSRDPDVFRDAANQRRQALSQTALGVRLVESNPEAASEEASSPHAKQLRAERVVELYFHQLFQPGSVLLDLRFSAFTERPAELLWHPAPWVVSFAPEFIAPLRQIYTGFYSGDDTRFRAGLDALDLRASEDVFRKHFGENQSEVHFRVSDFVDTFHEVFLRCKQARARLHPDFLPLGVYLAALYEHVERLEVGVDVQSTFGRVVPVARRGEVRALG